jgi:hypothetical protein
MSERDTGPIDPELQALLGAERDNQAPPEALARSWQRLETSIGGAGGGNGGGHTPPIPPTSHVASIAFASFIAGGVTGAILYATLAPPPAPVVSRVEPAAITTTVTAQASIAPTPPITLAPSAMPTTTPSATTKPTTTAAPASSIDQLEQERAQLDLARTRLAAGDGVGALAAVAAHERSFAHPQLAEEREAIAVQALALQHQDAEARKRAQRFHATWPNSLFAPVVDAAIASL